MPQPAAHLEGALNIDLDGCFHSPLGSSLGVFGPWYGSEEMLPAWEHLIAGEWGPAVPIEAATAAALTDR